MEAFVDGVDPAFRPAFEMKSISSVRDVAYLAREAQPWITLATDKRYQIVPALLAALPM
ncbi:hypothetical protein [Paraburkholderia sp. RL17-373-BIF-A]|uniref:hypothetical protein n=1 Tax=Paraburkholderia sp. RL17-373-BIF-A TaxID=3031629 RepID=UPI0038BBB08A